MKTHSQNLRNGKYKIFVTNDDMETYYAVIESASYPTHADIVGRFRDSRESFREFNPVLEE